MIVDRRTAAFHASASIFPIDARDWGTPKRHEAEAAEMSSKFIGEKAEAIRDLSKLIGKSIRQIEPEAWEYLKNRIPGLLECEIMAAIEGGLVGSPMVFANFGHFGQNLVSTPFKSCPNAPRLTVQG